MAPKYSEIIEKLGRNRVKLDEPMNQYTTFKIGGPADLFYEAKTIDDLIKAVKLAWELKIPYFILGGGSNLLVSDSGFRGLVIAIRDTQYVIRNTKVIAKAGISLRKLVEVASENSLSGFEFMAGIPGTLGGAVRGNAGAWQQNIGDKVSKVRVLGEDGRIKWLSQKNCQFQYRQSRFKKIKEVILEVELQLARGDKTEIERKIKENLKKREGQPKEPSAGCIFVNPAQRLPFPRLTASRHGGAYAGQVPTRLSAGKMIEECGLKEERVGNAQISPKHANFIVNLGQAKAEDVLQLIKLAKSAVQKKFNVKLELEISLLGFGRIRNDG